MKTALSTAQILEAIESLPSEEQARLLELLDPQKQKKQSSLLNIPSTLLNNPLLDEVSEQIEAYRRQRNPENQPDNQEPG